MSKDKSKQFPTFESDEALEQFADSADLSEYDFSSFKPMSFEFEPKDAQVTLRLSKSLLAAVKQRAEEKGISYQKLIRATLERSMQRPS